MENNFKNDQNLNDFTFDESRGNSFYNNQPRKKSKKKKYGAGVVVTSVVISSIVALIAGIIGSVYVLIYVYNPQQKGNIGTQKSGENTTNNVNINIDETAESVVQAVAKKVTPSVVGIRTTSSVMNFFGGTSEASGEGSGVIYSSDGYIITNHHVIAEALSSSGAKIEVFLGETADEAYEASVVGYNIAADLAVIKIDASSLSAIEIGKVDALEVGQYVITVGNPGGLEFMDSVTYGVISGLNRVVSADSGIELIQTDAAINPGNSGGALVNVKGQLIGINSSKIVSEEYEGMGFAIPIDTVLEICDDIIAREDEPEAYIGITISELYSAEDLQYLGYPVGAVVLSVANGSPAENAGIRRGDIITEFAGTKIDNYEKLSSLIKQSSPGEEVDAVIYRSGKFYSIKITIGSNN